tara:strand:- start:1835 stop:2074 length:240 start_codon:yes stop_codon:yes gene_type:complete
MTQEEKIDILFDKIRDLKVKTYSICKSDAASDVEEFMRQCCREWNSNNQEWEWMKPTKTVRLLKYYLKEEKQYIKENNL